LDRRPRPHGLLVGRPRPSPPAHAAAPPRRARTRPRPRPSAVTRSRSAAGTKVPADPAGRGDVACERTDVGAAAARRALDDLAVAEVERDVAARTVVDAEEDQVGGLVAAWRRLRANAARYPRRLRGGIVVREHAVSGPLRRGSEAGVDTSLGER